MLHRRVPGTASAAILLVLALAASACGGNAKATGEPSAPVSTSATPTATPTPTPTPTATPTPTPTVVPLSPFEGQAPVKGARAWAIAEAKAVNARDGAMASLASVATPQGISVTKAFARDDIAQGFRLPGPHPFTPTRVRVSGATATLAVCFMSSGWSVNRDTGKPVHPRQVVPVVIKMKRVSEAWLFDTFFAGTADCSKVLVKRVRW